LHRPGDESFRIIGAERRCGVAGPGGGIGEGGGSG
jgi:hypothetical protein